MHSPVNENVPRIYPYNNPMRQLFITSTLQMTRRRLREATACLLASVITSLQLQPSPLSLLTSKASLLCACKGLLLLLSCERSSTLEAGKQGREKDHV